MRSHHRHHDALNINSIDPGQLMTVTARLGGFGHAPVGQRCGEPLRPGRSGFGPVVQYGSLGARFGSLGSGFRNCGAAFGFGV